MSPCVSQIKRVSGKTQRFHVFEPEQHDDWGLVLILFAPSGNHIFLLSPPGRSPPAEAQSISNQLHVFVGTSYSYSKLVERKSAAEICSKCPSGASPEQQFGKRATGTSNPNPNPDDRAAEGLGAETGYENGFTAVLVGGGPAGGTRGLP